MRAQTPPNPTKFREMDAIVYQELFPGVRSLTADQLIASLDLVHHDESVMRPYTVVNFVTSADGRTAVEGRSRGLTDAGDRELHRTLRERADAVLAGTGTIAAEEYGRMLPARERRERRLAAARAAEPLAVTITRSGRLPLHVRLFAEPEARVVVFSPTPPALAVPGAPGRAAHVQHERLDQTTPAPLSAALRTLRERYDVRTLLCEGGPTLLGALLHEGLVDALFLTLAPTLVAGEGPAVASGPPLEVPVGLKLVGVLEREGSLFLSYTLE
jgi:riboflavin biosynthesis pyrimidine reductase